MNGAHQIGAGDVFIVNNYILGLIWGDDSIYLFDSHSKNENGNLRSVYYNTFPLTLYFQVQFIKVHCTATAKNTIKSGLKKERLSARREKDLLAKKRKYDNTEKKKQAFKERYHDKSESIRQYRKEKYLMN